MMRDLAQADGVAALFSFGGDAGGDEAFAGTPEVLGDDAERAVLARAQSACGAVRYVLELIHG
ncbi:hypothetical protein [Trueperella pyogenes]|uniref:hypothetical protein n=1 Tax=Trueperella pyogenes TaxID=1661 RepID=UPI003245B27D